jgi:CHAT domain-containing protein
MSEAFYDALSVGMPVSLSLSQARLKTRLWRSHPFYWAGPALFGGYQ